MEQKTVKCPACELRFLSRRARTVCPGCKQTIEPRTLEAVHA